MAEEEGACRELTRVCLGVAFFLWKEPHLANNTIIFTLITLSVGLAIMSRHNLLYICEGFVINCNCVNWPHGIRTLPTHNGLPCILITLPYV